MSCEYLLENGVYYMVCDGQKIPIDIDAPPAFKANLEKRIRKIAFEILRSRQRKIQHRRRH